jgi:type IV pilus assembly protein PilC
VAYYTYTARTKQGEKVDGSIEANTRRDAMVEIERRGQIPVSVKVQDAPTAAGGSKARFTWRRKEKMGTRDVLVFTTELSDLLASGMTLGNALNCLANRRGTEGDGNQTLVKLRDEIVRGSSLSEAMAQQPETFTTLYVSMIQAGEASGALAEVLERLVGHYERIQMVKEKVTMALVYPLIVMVMGAATLIFSMVYVVPKFQMVFAQLGQALPLPTRILIATSSWMSHYGWLALIVIVVASIMMNRYVKTPRGMEWWHGALLKTPLIRGVVASGIYSNFARTLGTLMANGVPVLQALGIVERTVGNAVIGKEIAKARQRVTDGTTISGPFAEGGVFPTMLTDMLSIGEQTGDMATALTHIARRYENELDRNVTVFTTALEPILIVVVALLVGFVAISILMAVFNLTNGLNV